MLAKTVTLFLLGFMLQVEALPAVQDYSPIDKRISQELDVFSAEEVVSFIGDNSDTIKELVPSVVSAIYKMATCNTETKALVLPHIDDVMACINITMSVYDTEVLLYRAVQFCVEVYDNVLDLGSNLLECHNESTNFFGLIECAFNTVESSSPVFLPLLNGTAELVLDLVNDYYELTDNIKKCVGFSSNTVVAAWHVISNQC